MTQQLQYSKNNPIDIQTLISFDRAIENIQDGIADMKDLDNRIVIDAFVSPNANVRNNVVIEEKLNDVSQSTNEEVEISVNRKSYNG